METARAVRLRAPQNQHGQRHQYKGKERADVGEVGKRPDVEDPRGNGHRNSSHPRGNVRGPESRVDVREGFRQQAVARHRKPDARLAELVDEQR